MAGQRTQQLADRIKVIVAQMLERRVKDPRLGFVTITDVRLSGDNQHASVFYTVMGDQTAVEGTGAALTSATGLLRSEVGKQLRLRHTPSLEFFLDQIPDEARHIDDLLERAKASDAEVAAKAAGADYAGEPDPYRHRDDEDEADENA